MGLAEASDDFASALDKAHQGGNGDLPRDQPTERARKCSYLDLISPNTNDGGGGGA
jgi:hypothetical protein